MLPAVCGRVYPQENQCGGVCIMGSAANQLLLVSRRFLGDQPELSFKPKLSRSKQQKVAVVGASPSGIACAGELLVTADVTVFEGILHRRRSGFGIPESVFQGCC